MTKECRRPVLYSVRRTLAHFRHRTALGAECVSSIIVLYVRAYQRLHQVPHTPTDSLPHALHLWDYIKHQLFELNGLHWEPNALGSCLKGGTCHAYVSTFTLYVYYIILHHIIIHYVGWAHVGREPLFLTQLSSTAWLLASGCRAWRDNLVSTLEVLTCARLRICLRLLMAG